MFRASPWVPYDPTRNSSSSPPNPAASIPDEMDAPQISVLQPTNDDSPPPQPRPAKFRIKLLVNEPARPSSSGSSAAIRIPTLGSHELDIEDEDEEDEEDQLIDDDDDDGRAPSALSRSVDTTPKRKAASPRKRARKGDKKVEDEKKIILPDPPIEATHSQQSSVAGPSQDTTVIKLSLKRKAPSPRKPAAKPKGKGSKSAKNPALPLLDDPAALSEGQTGTAPSSPGTVYRDLNTPELDPLPAPTISLPPTSELSSIPLPVYPLPSKPFPVQPPPKISTGFAPIIPLDIITKSPVRRWRRRHREIRGIAGGRWFAVAWAGEKESEYAVEAEKKAAEDEKKVVGKPKVKAKSLVAASSAGPSRSSSVNPEPMLMPHATREPTKMRMIVAPLAMGEGDGDVEMLPLEA